MERDKLNCAMYIVSSKLNCKEQFAQINLQRTISTKHIEKSNLHKAKYTKKLTYSNQPKINCNEKQAGAELGQAQVR